MASRIVVFAMDKESFREVQVEAGLDENKLGAVSAARSAKLWKGCSPSTIVESGATS